MNYKKAIAVALACLMLCGGLTGCAQRYGDLVEYTLPWGTPIVGGLEAVYEIVDADAVSCEEVKAVFEKRLEAFGVEDYEVLCDQAEATLTVRLTGNEQDCMNVARELMVTGSVEFRLGDETDDEGNPTGELVLDHSQITEADTAYMYSGGYSVVVKMNESGKEAFAAATKKQAESKGVISIWLVYSERYAQENGVSRYELISAPTVNEEITIGEAAIASSNDYEKVALIAFAINGLPSEVVLRDYKLTSTPLLDFAKWLYQE